ncbi:DUF4307 domain-containing protein [Natronoglycomyces albus]|uniref:DUF4307 domain-containing protein n=1 Tax=Natronoglycomyces albus TaxID=2811108 RepID=A0A895XS05_9ACTN|nr:DUF4307 domain-containing protein [Natronoglycomyces albus]QSB05975.1 DUF4307 domain-containing protein [Natronoglycomyces albus]
MSETGTTEVRFPPGRYGRRRESTHRRKWIAGGLSALVIAGGVGVSLIMYDKYGDPNFSATVQGYQLHPDEVEITFQVTKPADEEAICLLRSRDMSGAEIGNANVVIPTGEEDKVSVTYNLSVDGDPNTAEVLKCWPAS